MFGIGSNELILILIFAFLIFGPDKMPAIAKTIGQAIAKFRNAQNEMNKVIKEEVWDPNSDEPFKNPLDTMAKLDKTVKGESEQESFSKRKERYEKQQAAKKRAEERRAQKAAERAQAHAQQDGESGEGSETAAAAAAGGSAVATAAVGSATAAKEASSKTEPEHTPSSIDAEKTEETPAKPKLTADSLYGVAPVAKKPKPKPSVQVESDASDDSTPAASVVSVDSGEGE